MDLRLTKSNRVRPKKHLGQHFLRDEQVAKMIADSLVGANEKQQLLEIGPGMGVLTKYLIHNPAFDMSVIEIDRESVAYLRKNFPALNDRIIEQDFLKWELNENYGEKLVIIGNLPYNISSQIFFKVLEYRDVVEQVVCMLQKEVAERLVSPPGSRDYGILSVFLQAYYNLEYLFSVPPSAFYPPPKVQSGVIRLIRNKVIELTCDEKLFRTVVKTAFNQRRKMLRNALAPLGDVPGHPFEEKRAEQLGVDDYVILTNIIAART